MKKILFSPIGGTDPISNFRDGAMLHICRIFNIFFHLSFYNFLNVSLA